MIKYITMARLEFAMRLLLGLYAGADAWMHFMTPIVKEEKVSVVSHLHGRFLYVHGTVI